MNRAKRTVVAGVTTALLLAGLSATSAVAVPEIGRCVAKPGGKYLDGNCAKKGTGSFEFVKNAVRKKFTTAGGELKYSGASGTEIRCTTQSATGEYFEKNATPTTREVHHVVAVFKGCGLPLLDVPCRTKGAAEGEIITTQLKGPLVYVSGQKTPSVIVAQALSPEVKKKGFAEFECPALGVVIYIGEGLEQGHETVLADIGPLNTMATTFTQTYQQVKAGQQLPQSKEGSTVIDNLEQSLSGPKGTFERASAILETTITNEEALEIKP